MKEISERPIVELYTDLFGEGNWNGLPDEYVSIHKAVGKIRNKREKLNGQTKKSIRDSKSSR